MRSERLKATRRATTAIARQTAVDYVSAVRAATVCATCGSQPVEFHRAEHVAKPSWRVHALCGNGASIARIQREINLCQPLCRRCHMTEDGRLKAFIKLRQARQRFSAPCVDCGRTPDRSRRGRCNRCYRRHLEKGRQFRDKPKPSPEDFTAAGKSKMSRPGR